MKLTLRSSRAFAALCLAFLIHASLRAQSVLFTEMDGKFVPVRAANRNRPLVDQDGKRVIADGGRYALQKATEYRPEFVDVKNIQVKTHHLNMGGSELNHDFIFYSVVETPYYLEDVFIVLELDSDRAGKVLFLQEVGTLEPQFPKTISVTVPLGGGGIGEGKYKFHLFAGGRELMTTKMPPLQRDQLLDGMIRKRISGATDQAPALFVGPEPEYPKALRKAGTAGQAVITAHIDDKGRVRDPQVKQATAPAFGEAALAAVRLWRFLPRVKDGRPVDTVADVPVNFSSPKKG